MNLPVSSILISVFFLSRSVGSDKAKRMERDVETANKIKQMWFTQAARNPHPQPLCWPFIVVQIAQCPCTGLRNAIKMLWRAEGWVFGMWTVEGWWRWESPVGMDPSLWGYSMLAAASYCWCVLNLLLKQPNASLSQETSSCTYQK